MTRDNCCCKVGPGRMEAEPAETAMLECFALDGGGEQHGPEGASYEYFAPVDGDGVFGPGDFSDDVIQGARSAGFCWPCIARGIERLMACHGACFGVTEQGFRWSKVADDAGDHRDMLARMAEDDAGAEAEADDFAG